MSNFVVLDVAHCEVKHCANSSDCTGPDSGPKVEKVVHGRWRRKEAV